MRSSKRIITDFHFDVHDIFITWESGKIKDKEALEKLLNLSMYFLREMFAYAIKGSK